MKKRLILILIGSHTALIMLLVLSCASSQEIKSKKNEETDSKGELVFQSGFEGSTQVVQDLNTNDYGAPYEHIEGKDNTLTSKNDWDKDWATILKGNSMQIQYTGGDATKRFAKVIPEPKNPTNHVLQFWLDDAWLASENQEKARIQANIYGIKSGFKEYSQSVRVFLTDDFNVLKNYPHKISWLTISEFWNNEWWVKDEKFGFRISLGIGKPTAQSSDLNFILNAENNGQIEVWKANNTNVKVPIGKWFTMNYYLKEGNKENGRFVISITPDGEQTQTVADVTNFTHNTTDLNPNGITGYNPLKLYTSKDVVHFVKSKGKTLQVYWDDFKLWKKR